MDHGARLEPTYAVVSLLDAVGSDEGFADAHGKRSVAWRLVHSMLCIIGGVAFLLGSIQYFPSISRHTFGAGLFTLGSFGFFLADVMDWITNHSTILCRLGQVHEHKSEKRQQVLLVCCNQTWSYQLESAINAGLTTIGSLCYFIGCILFIPALRSTVIGDILFIPGSLIIFVSMIWKLYRTGCTPQCALDEVLNNTTGFKWRNVWNSELAPLVGDVSLLFGAAAFLAGSILFLPALDANNHDTWVATLVFVIGSALFISTGCALFYGYFIATYTGGVYTGGV